MIGLVLFSVLVLPFSVQACGAGTSGKEARDHETKVMPEYVADQLLVTFREGTAQSRINAINESLNVQVIRKMLFGRVNLVKVPEDKSLEDLRRAYSSFTEVETVEPNYKARIQGGKP